MKIAERNGGKFMKISTKKARQSHCLDCLREDVLIALTFCLLASGRRVVCSYGNVYSIYIFHLIWNCFPYKYLLFECRVLGY